MRENAIQLPISSLLHSLFFILAVQGTSVISGLAGERDFAVDKNQKVQQEMVIGKIIPSHAQIERIGC